MRDRLFSLSLVRLLLNIEVEDAFTVLLYARLAVRYTLSPFPFFWIGLLMRTFRDREDIIIIYCIPTTSPMSLP